MKAGDLHHAAVSRLAEVYHLSHWTTRYLRENNSIGFLLEVPLCWSSL